MDKKIFNLINWLDGGMAPPYLLEIRLTNLCNLKCLSCWHRISIRKWDYSTELSSNKWVKVVKDAGRIGVRRIEITGGGEPLIKLGTFSKIVEQVSQYGMEGCLTTNGTLFTEDLIKKMIISGWDEVLLSLDGPDAETHDYLRQKKGCFNRIINNLKLFEKWENKLGLPKPEIKFVPVLSSINFDKLPKFIELAVELGIHEVRFQPLYTLREKQNFLRLTEGHYKKLSKIIPEVMDLAKKFNINTNADVFLREKFQSGKEGSIDIYKNDMAGLEENNFLSSPCFFPWFYMGIRADGVVTPCTAFDEFRAVESLNKKDILSIWYGKNFLNFRKDLLNHKFRSCCKTCCGGLIINNRDIRRQLNCYVDIQHMNFLDIISMKDGRGAVEKELKEIKDSLSFKIGSRIDKTAIGKFLKKCLNKNG